MLLLSNDQSDAIIYTILYFYLIVGTGFIISGVIKLFKRLTSKH